MEVVLKARPPRTASRRAHVVVVGAGLLGAAAAWQLARQGLRVTVVEQAGFAGAGVSQWSYGWVGSGSRERIENAERFAFERRAACEYQDLARQLGSLPVAARGALVWLDDAEQTEAMVAAQAAAGVPIECIGPTRVQALQPGLARPPALAAWLPDDFAVEPATLARQLLAAARQAGARIHYGQAVMGLEAHGGKVRGVRLGQGTLQADVVLLANAGRMSSLVEGLGMRLPVHTAPAVLMRFGAPAGLLGPLLYGEGLECRAGRGAGLVAAGDCPASGEAGLPALLAQQAEAIAGLFVQRPPITPLAARMVWRPMTDDGQPLCGFAPRLNGLYLLLAHPGVMLGPWLARRAAEEIGSALCGGLAD